MAKKYLKRTVDEVMQFAKDQRSNPTQSWQGLCQSFCRNSYGVSAWSPSAIKAWEMTPKSEKHVGGKPGDAPRGALLYYSGGQYGHVALAMGKKTHDRCFTNDYTGAGEIGVAPRTFPRWGIKYLGWSTWTPYGSLDLNS